jgi:hypothetical protein
MLRIEIKRIDRDNKKSVFNKKGANIIEFCIIHQAIMPSFYGKFVGI